MLGEVLYQVLTKKLMPLPLSSALFTMVKRLLVAKIFFKCGPLHTCKLVQYHSFKVFMAPFRLLLDCCYSTVRIYCLYSTDPPVLPCKSDVGRGVPRMLFVPFNSDLAVIVWRQIGPSATRTSTSTVQ